MTQAMMACSARLTTGTCNGRSKYPRDHRVEPDTFVQLGFDNAFVLP
jgi:hypothetical protein